MSNFQRRLDRIDGLWALATADGENWWKELLQKWRPAGESAESDGLRLAIRDNYLNFYRRGQSVARVGFDQSGVPCASVHLKYLGVEEVAEGKEYARLKNGCFTASGHPEIPVIIGETLQSIIASSEKWTGREKFMVDLVVDQTRSVVDLEIGLPRIDKTGGAPRIDLAVLEESQAANKIQLVFWEAKTIDDSRLRATKPEDADVHIQLGKYVGYMKDDKRRANAAEAYRENCRLLVELAKMAGKEERLSPLIYRVTQEPGNFDIDRKPRLVIFEGKTQRGIDPCEVQRAGRWDDYERVITRDWTTRFSARDGYQLCY